MSPSGRSTADAVLRRWAADVEAAHADLARLDRLAGDGDFGDNLRGGLRRVVARLDEAGPGSGRALAVAGQVFLDEVGGTSGPLFGLLLSELARAEEPSADGTADDITTWRTGLAEGLAAVQRVGEAEVGDRTLVDALEPAARSLAEGGSVTEAALAALDGARRTADVRARRGRSAYLGDRVVGAPDPGAVAVAMLLRAAAETLDPAAAEHLMAGDELLAAGT